MMSVPYRLAIALTLTLVGAVAHADHDVGNGFSTSVGELRKAATRARYGHQPDRWVAAKVVADAREPWRFGAVDTRFGTVVSGGVRRCAQLEAPAAERLLAVGGQLIYARVLAYNLTGEERYAREAKRLLLRFSRSGGYDEVDGIATYDGANQCALDISLFLPLMIDSAILLESYPGWRPYHKRRLQRWLADVPYRTTSAIARTRKNNWGTAAAFASWSIAHYLIGSAIRLEEVHPEPRVLYPRDARASHLRSQINMMNTTWRGDSKCELFGIRPDGGIPNELRRGSTGCYGKHLIAKDSSYGYQTVTLRNLIYHAEAVRRHMHDELFEFGAVEGVTAIHRAIRFVIDNPEGESHDWDQSKIGILRVAARAYPDEAICAQIDKSKPSYYREGLYLPYTKLTQPTPDCTVAREP